MKIGCGLFGVLELRSKYNRLIYGVFRERFCFLSFRKTGERGCKSDLQPGFFPCAGLVWGRAIGTAAGIYPVAGKRSSAYGVQELERGTIINRIGGRVSWRDGVVFQKNIKCVPADAESPLFRISEGLFPVAKEPIGVPIQK